MSTHYTISLGAGVQSTYLYLLAMDGTLQYIHRDRDKWGRTISKEWRPLPVEMAIFADTGDEPATVAKEDATKAAQPELFDNFDNECQGICGV